MLTRKKAYWMLIGNVGTAVGILFLIGAGHSYDYFEIHRWNGWDTAYPLQQYVLVFLILGIISLIIGQRYLRKAYSFWYARAGTALGTGFLIGAVSSYFFEIPWAGEYTIWGPPQVYPFREYVPYFLLLGIVFLITGQFCFLWRVRSQHEG